jgi:hypothetical protein
VTGKKDNPVACHPYKAIGYRGTGQVLATKAACRTASPEIGRTPGVDDDGDDIIDDVPSTSAGVRSCGDGHCDPLATASARATAATAAAAPSGYCNDCIICNITVTAPR